MSTQWIRLSKLSCSAATDCTAVGSYGLRPSEEPIYATETAGVWGEAHELSAPGGGYFSDVSCSSATNCTAIGGSDLNNEPIYATETAGVWGALTVGTASLSGLSCTSATYCTGVGGDSSGRPIYAVESDGTWGAATEIAAPAGAVELSDVSCSSATDCTAIGTDQVNLLDDPIYVTETGGVWGAATEIAAPADSDLGSISCASAMNCTAVGFSGVPTGPASAPNAIYDTETAGVWGAITFVEGADWLFGVDCTSTLDCTAVGGDYSQAIYDTETAGAWGPATEVVSPTDSGYFSDVSCSSATDCTAVGLDGSGFAIYPTETAGVWPKVPRAPRYVKVIAGNRSVKVAWTAPATDGRPQVLGYTATASATIRDSLTVYMCRTLQRSCTIRGLTKQTTYAVSVTARNLVGSSANSATKRVKPRE